MTSLSRMLSVLNLFSAEQPKLDAEQISDAIGCSTPTGYRYVKELMQAGLLQRLNGGSYALGPRIALLDYIIRSSDPLLEISIAIMRELVEKTDCRCILSRMDGPVFLDLHHEGVPQDLQLTYGRGRPRPLFKGSAPKVIIANLSARKLRNLYEQHVEEIGQIGLGTNWKDFQEAMSRIRREGFYISNDELEAGISSISVPVKLSAKDSYAALALVTSTARFELIDQSKLLELMRLASQKITERAAAAGVLEAP